MKPYIPILISCLIALSSCQEKRMKKVEQLTQSEFEDSVSVDSSGVTLSSLNQLSHSPSSVLLTGMDSIKLIPIYKLRKKADRSINHDFSSTYTSREYEPKMNYRYFMPGIDLLRGYNLVNVAHYNTNTGKLSYLFDKPSLIRNLYFPGTRQDSLNRMPIKRDYFLVSTYDGDTNNDSIINWKDKRKLYFIDKDNTQRISLLPPNFSAIRSTYDYKSDLMYIYAREDANANGQVEKNEPVKLFFVNLKRPTVAVRML